ncbi:MAG: phospholipase/Carboxylesterase [Ilumatobacteraceae bacterium]|nr:phospholipase/Carboxylesterase [Ilumatobacteraceae bacterium]
MIRRPLLRGCALVLAAATIATACSSNSTSNPSATSTTSSTATAVTVASTGASTVASAPVTGPATTEVVTTGATTAPTSATSAAPETSAAPATSTADSTALSDPVLTAPFPTTEVDETFVDTTRGTDATADAAALPTRTLPTKIIVPQAPGPFPLIILAHGLVGSAAKLSNLATAWATAGYVVALPTFPLTSDLNPDVIAHENDVANQPADVTFVISHVLALNGDDSSPLFGRIDVNEIGMAGHSLGGATTYGIVYNDCCVDSRIKAAIIMSGLVEVSPTTTDYNRTIPTLILHGDADTDVNIAEDQGPYAKLAGPKWFITLIGGEHATGFENPATPYNALVEAATTDFWNQYLSAVPGSLDALRHDGAVDGLSTLQTDQ